MVNKRKTRLRGCTAFLLAAVVLAGGLCGCKQDTAQNETSSAPPTGTTEQTIPTTAAPQEIINGTVNVDELNVREGVGISYEVVTTLSRGDRVAILEQQDLNGVMWGRIENGWICLEYVHIDGTPMDEEPDETTTVLEDPVSGKVLATELNIRKGPGTNYDVCGTLFNGNNVTVTETKGNWGKTDSGWVNMIFVYFPDSLDSETVEAVVDADDLNVRTGPGTSYESLYKVNTGTEVTIYKQVTIRNTRWGYIGDGWLCMDYVEIK